MKELIQRLRLTSLGRLFWAWLTVCTLCVVLCWTLFGWIKLLFLLTVCGLSYCSASYLYYSAEGRPWREQVDRWYEELFILTLNYEHAPPLGLQAQKESSLKLPTKQVKLASTSQDSSSRRNTGRPQPSKMCHREAQKMIQLIMKHFVHSWYDGITDDVEFPEDIQKLLEHVALEVNIRLKQIDLEEIVCEIATLVLPYLEAVNEAGERDLNGVKVFDVTHEKCVKEFESNMNVEHRTLRSREQELRYYRQALDTLIQCAAPNEYTGCDSACMFVREILLANIIEPLLDLFCDPDFLYHSIPMVLSKASKEKVERELADMQQENEKLEKQLSRGRLMVKIQGGQRVRFHSLSSNRFGSSFNEGSPSILRQSSFSKATPPSRPTSMAEIPSSISDRIGSPRTWHLGVQEPPYKHNRGIRDNVESFDRQFHSPFPSKIDSSQRSPDLQSTPLAASVHPDYTVMGFDVREDYYDDVGNEEVPPETDFVYVQPALVYIDRHVRVVGGGASSYIAYVFKFPKRMLNEAELNELNVSESDSHLNAMKRYREFRSLHTKLLKSSSFAQHIKGLELPERGRVTSIVAKLPFASVDPDPAFLLERRQGLEKYLQSICSVKVIAESDLFHAFLRSGVQSLKEAHVVSNPQKAKRRSFLGIVKTPAVEEAQKAEPIPKRPIESVLSGYLNTHLPLPCCSFHSIHTIRNKRRKPSHPPTEMPYQPHSSSLRVHSRVFGNSELNVDSVSSTQYFSGSSVSTEDTSETPAVVANPGGMVETVVLPTLVRENPSQTVITTTGTRDFTSWSSGELSQPTTGDTCTASNEDTGELSVTGSDLRTKAFVPSPFVDKMETSVRLRGNVAKKVKSDGTDIHQLMSLKKVQQNSSDDTPTPTFRTKIKQMVHLVVMFILLLISRVCYIIKRGVDPITQYSTFTLVKEQEMRVPLTNALFSLGSEVSSKHCPELWASNEHTQLALLVVVGGASERYIWKELKEVMYAEENWARGLFHLRHTLWPDGEVMKKLSQKLSEKERNEKKQAAAEAIKKFLPNFLPYIVGSDDYNAAVIHCLNCLANPRLNRHFILRVMEVFLMRLIPEICDSGFKVQLERLRTLKFAHGKSSIPSVSAFHRRMMLHKSDTF